MIEKLKQRLSEFGPIEEDFWKEVLAHHKLLNVKKDELLIRYNTASKDAYYILSGSFLVSQISESGTKKAIWFHFDDIFDVVASPDSYFKDGLTKYEVKALEDAVVVKLNKQRIDEWIKKYASFNNFFINKFVLDFLTIYEARSSLLTFTSLEFLKYTKEHFPFIFDRLPSYLIADFIGVTPEWYSKLQKKLDA